MKLKIVSISFVILTIAFSILSCSNIFNNSRKYYEEQLDETRQALLENIEFQEELESHGNRYNNELSLTENSEEALREWMRDCQQEINEYKQKALIFGLFAG